MEWSGVDWIGSDGAGRSFLLSVAGEQEEREREASTNRVRFLSTL